jgi:hypothetical protein
MRKAICIGAAVTIAALGALALVRSAFSTLDRVNRVGGPSLQVLLRHGPGNAGVSGDIIVRNARGRRIASTSVGTDGKTLAVGAGHYVVVGVSESGRACGPTPVEVGSDSQAVYVACR